MISCTTERIFNTINSDLYVRNKKTKELKKLDTLYNTLIPNVFDTVTCSKGICFVVDRDIKFDRQGNLLKCDLEVSIIKPAKTK